MAQRINKVRSNTFIRIAEDSPVQRGIIPIGVRKEDPVHVIQYEVLLEHPYEYDEEELSYEVHVVRRDKPNLDRSRYNKAQSACEEIRVGHSR